MVREVRARESKGEKRRRRWLSRQKEKTANAKALAGCKGASL